jgi:parallel beta-helix repeat protein
VSGASVTLTNSTIQWSGGDGLTWINGASGQVTNNTIINNLANGISVKGSSNPTIQANTLTDNSNYSVYLEGNSFPVFTGNIFYGNAKNGIGVYGVIGTGTWFANLPYLATLDLVVEASSTLTLQPGTVVKFSASQDFIIRGALVASGTSTNPIVITSFKDDAYGGDSGQDGSATRPNPGDWGTVYFADTSNDAISVLENVLIRFGGAAYNYGSGSSYADLTLDSASPRVDNSFFTRSSSYGVQMINASSPTFQGNVIADNTSHGLWLSPSSGPQVSNNTFTHNGGYAAYVTGSSQVVFSNNTATNNKTNGIGITGTINSDTTWEYDLPYVIESTLTLDVNTTLTIQPNVIVKFTSAAAFTINGKLLAQGSSDHRIYFTSVKDDSLGGDTNGDSNATAPNKGDWNAIRFASTGGQSSLD